MIYSYVTVDHPPKAGIPAGTKAVLLVVSCAGVVLRLFGYPGSCEAWTIGVGSVEVLRGYIEAARGFAPHAGCLCRTHGQRNNNAAFILQWCLCFSPWLA